MTRGEFRVEDGQFGVGWRPLRADGFMTAPAGCGGGRKAGARSSKHRHRRHGRHLLPGRRDGRNFNKCQRPEHRRFRGEQHAHDGSWDWRSCRTTRSFSVAMARCSHGQSLDLRHRGLSTGNPPFLTLERSGIKSALLGSGTPSARQARDAANARQIMKRTGDV